MTTCSNSETILATSSAAVSASDADMKAAGPMTDKPEIEAPKLDASAAAGPGPENAPLGRTNIFPPLDASSLKALSAVAAIVEAPAREATPAPAGPLMADDPPPLPRPQGASVAAATPVATAQKQSSWFTLVAASLVFAAGIGATLAALAMSGFPWPAPEPIPEQMSAAPPPAPVVGADDIRALQGTIAQLRSDLAALKSSVEGGARSTNSQFAKISERIDRAQSEQAAKINKAVDGVERLEKRADFASAREVTGSVPQPHVPPAALGNFARPTVAPPLSFAANTRPIVKDWVVQEVHGGVAVIQGRRGAIEVETGDMVPGLGRIGEIRKQGNRWVVMTARGPVTSSQ